MTRPTHADLAPLLPPPADLTALTDGELARHCWAMGWRYSDGCADHVHRLLFEAAKRLGSHLEEPRE
jgi:hypothetical protein